MTEPIPLISLESMDGSVSIILDSKTGWTRMPGSTGLKMPPYEIISSAIPGVPGSTVQDVRVQERPIFIPIYCQSSTSQRSYLEMVDTLFSLVDPTSGSFKIVATTVRGVRELEVTYDGGLEGADGGDSDGLSWMKAGLKAVANDPFARAREDTRMEFRVENNAVPFLGVAGGSDAPWPTALSSSSVIGSGMEVPIYSEVPVYPTLELVGAMTSFEGTLSPTVILPNGTPVTIEDQAWNVEVGSISAGSTFRMVTDPRVRSIRLDGALAAGMVTRGSTLRPFYPGLNTLSVVAPGATVDTLIILSWRDLFRSLW